MFSSSTAKKLMSYWEDALSDQQKKKVKMLVDGGNFILFFRYQNEVYGAPENSRVVFAKMRDPNDEDNNAGWLKEANFTATSLTKLGQGQANQMMFNEKDVKSIDVLTKEEAYEALEEFFEKSK